MTTTTTSTPQFGFQRLHVYNFAVRFVAAAMPIAERVPKGYAALGDQLRRAAISIPLNIAEGTGRYGRDAAQLFAVARSSAFECAAMLDLVGVLVAAARPEVDAAKNDLVQVVNILTVLIRRHGGSIGKAGGGGGGGEDQG